VVKIPEDLSKKSKVRSPYHSQKIEGGYGVVINEKENGWYHAILLSEEYGVYDLRTNEFHSISTSSTPAQGKP
ncbi:MAG: hypothetical protein ABEJ72_02020, partial [Candidatus Aenigmatarchaeota archaeon]